MDRDYSQSDELEQTLRKAIAQANDLGAAYIRYNDLMKLRRELYHAIDYALSNLIDNLDVC